MRITVYDVLSYLAAGDTIEELLEHFPMLTRQDVQACLAYAADAEDRLKLDFTQSYYGPYSGKVRHLLYAVNGFYLRGFEQKQAKPFEALELVVKHKPLVDAYVEQHLSTTAKQRLQRVGSFMSGFESPYGLELLATVDFAMNVTGANEPEKIAIYIKQWSARKANMFSASHIALAIDHIETNIPRR